MRNLILILALIGCGAEQAAPKAALGSDPTAPAAQDGEDGQGCSVEDDPAGAAVVCGKERQVLKDGAQGQAGADGSAGIQGEKGDAGEQGAAGADGADGAQGAAGADGSAANRVWVEAGSGEWIGELLEMASTEVTVVRDAQRFTLSWASGYLTAPYNIYFAGAACSGEARMNASGSSYYLRNVFRDPAAQALVYEAQGEIDQAAWAYVSVMPAAGGPCVAASNSLAASRQIAHTTLPFAYPVSQAVIGN